MSDNKMENFAVKSLKSAHPQYNSSVVHTIESFGGSLRGQKDDSKKSKKKLPYIKAEPSMVKKKDDGEQATSALIAEKYAEIAKGNKIRGNLLYRYFNLEFADPSLSYNFKDQIGENRKEITRLSKMMGLNFGKKTITDAYYGVFYMIFDTYIKQEYPVQMENLEKALNLQFESDGLEVKLTPEIMSRLSNLFEYLMKNSFIILNSEVVSEDHLMEAKAGDLKIGYDHIRSA